MLLFTYQGKDWHSFTPSVCLTEVWKATVDKRMVSKRMCLSQYAPKGVKSLCITSSQTVYVRKPDLVSSKTLQRLGGRLICEIYLNTYFQRARLGGRLICELGSIYGSWNLWSFSHCIWYWKCPKCIVETFWWEHCRLCISWCIAAFWRHTADARTF